ncbi:hypothetical protein DFH09DRAFT_1094305 [Mycena vulgaris]|nr:hypothetical protein DFH09DRAFT_1094305 [Mycena vulgaris]
MTLDMNSSNGTRSSTDSTATARTLQGRYRKRRKPRAGCEYSPCQFIIAVLANERLQKWEPPCTTVYRQAQNGTAGPAGFQKFIEVMLLGLDESTRSNYGAGLLCFTQFCDTLSIREEARMPASAHLLAIFTSDAAGYSSESTDAAVWPQWTVACVTFWGCCRLRELLPCNKAAFHPSHHVTRGQEIHFENKEGGQAVSTGFHIPWTKVTKKEGAEICVSKPDPALSTQYAIRQHLRANVNVPPYASLFAYEKEGGEHHNMKLTHMGRKRTVDSQRP